MKTQPLIMRTITLATALPLILALPLSASAAESTKKAAPAAAVNNIASAKDTAHKGTQGDARQQIVKEAVDAANATHIALDALNDHQPKQALAALQVASGNLHFLLARDPALGLVPIDIKVQILEGTTDLKTIKKLDDVLDDLIDDGQYQAARPILDSLADEIRLTVVSLPLATYPAALDQIVPMVDAGKLTEAKEALIKTLDTLVYEQEVTPLSILRAEDKLDEAINIKNKEDLTQQATKDKISLLVSEANQNVKVAEALGYGTKKDYKLLYDGMDDLKKSIGTAGFEGEWSKIKSAISAFKNKVIHAAS